MASFTIYPQRYVMPSGFENILYRSVVFACSPKMLYLHLQTDSDMVFFPNCKINIGLDILRRRDDGFHEVETLMYPVGGLCDILEIVPAVGDDVIFSSAGLAMDCPAENNLCVKAYRLMKERYGLGGVKMHLHKITPSGAGLGGGSADAAYTVKGLDRMFRLGLADGEMEEIAGRLGSDTLFFIKNEPVIARGRGEIMERCDAPLQELKGKLLIIAKPPFGISTAEAYSGIVPVVPEVPLAERLSSGLDGWRENVGNGFEKHLFKAYPQLTFIKDAFYGHGALYASMSGSGSSVFGIFEVPENIPLDNGEPQLCGWSHTVEQVLCRMIPGVFIYHEVMV